MSVPSTDFQTTYTTDGVAVKFDFDWRVVELDSVQIYLNTVLQDPGLYNLTKNIVGLGGYVTFLVAPVAAQTLLIQRVSDTLQDDALENQASLPPATLIDMFDKLTIIAQQLTAQINLSLSLSLTLADSGVSAVLPTPVAGAIFAWNAAALAVAYITPGSGNVGQVLTNAGVGQIPVWTNSGGGGGGGDVSFIDTGPTVYNSAIAYFNDATGLNITSGGPHGAAGTVFTSTGAGTFPQWQTPVGSLLKAAAVTAAAPGLPTSGNWDSGEYFHFGIWTQTGDITYDDSVFIYHNGVLMDFINGFTCISNGSAIQSDPGAYSNTQNLAIPQTGGGIGGGQNHLYAAADCGGSGGGFGGLGGDGHNTATVRNAGWAGKPYHYRSQFSGSEGSPGSVVTAGGGTHAVGRGGIGGSGLYIETTGAISFSTVGGVPSITNNGADGGNAGSLSGGGGGGGSAGAVVIRAAGVIANGNGTNTIQCKGGDGGSSATANCGGAGGAGGWIDVQSASAITATGWDVAGGTHGGTGTETSGNPGQTKIVQNTMIASVF